MQSRKSQIILIVSLLAMAGILIYMNFIQSNEAPADAVNNPGVSPAAQEFSYEGYINGIRDTLNPTLKYQLDSLEKSVHADSGNYQSRLALASFWNSIGCTLPAAMNMEVIAQRLNDEANWLTTGTKFYDYAQASSDTVSQLFAQKHAIAAFEHVRQTNPDNMDALKAMAICNVTNDLDMMRGVQLLKEVLNKDSNDVDALVTLGMLSERSGQLDKARMRFEKLVRIQPTNAEYHFYLAEIYAKMDMKPEAIRTFETCRDLVPDEGAKKEITNIIENLKKGK